MKIISSIQNVLEKDTRVVFAYLYGSALEGDRYQDIDIGIYITGGDDPIHITSDLKVAFSIETGLSPDKFDIQVINQVNNLFYLRHVLDGRVLVDNDPDLRGDFIESFSMRYREAEGILKEAY